MKANFPEVVTRSAKHGQCFDVHQVKKGWVYGRRWPAGVESQPFIGNLVRVPLEVFLRDVVGAVVIQGVEQKDTEGTKG